MNQFAGKIVVSLSRFKYSIENKGKSFAGDFLNWKEEG
jgi:hypothetical protein